MSAPPTVPPAPRPRPLVTRMVRELGHQVLVEPVRDGRLRGDDWPTGVRPAVAVGLTIYALASAVTIAGGWLRRALPPGDSAFGISPALFGAGVLLVILLAALVLTASLNLRGPLGVVGLLPAPVAWASLLPYAQTPGPVAWLAVGVVALTGLWLWRRSRPFAWWELPLAIGVIGALTLTIVAQVTRPALGQDYFDTGLELAVLIMSVGVFALPLTVHAGAALSELALSTAGWLVEVVSRELPRRAYAPVLLVALLAGWLLAGWRWSASVLPTGPHLLSIVIAALLVLLTALAWLLLGRTAGPATGPVAATTTGQLDELVDAFRTLLLVLSIAVSAPFVLSYAWGRLEFGLRPALRAWGLDYVPGNLINRLRLDGVVDTVSAGYPVAALAGGVLVAYGLRRGRLVLAQLAAVTTLLCLARAASAFDVPFLGVTLDDLSAVALAVATGSTLWWLVRGELGPQQGRAGAVTLVVAVGIASRDALADPLAWALQSSGGVLVVLGLLWTLLTFAGDANSDSLGAPRAARAIALVAYLAIAAVIAAFDALAVTFAIDLDRFVRIGLELFGTALLLAAIWTLLSAAGGTARRRGAPRPDGSVGSQVYGQL